MLKTLLKISFIASSFLLTVPAPDAFADKVCITIAKSKIVRRVVASTKKCPKGHTEIIDTVKLLGPAGPAGPEGQAGPTGSSGSAGLNGTSSSDFVWGTGADGDVTLSGTTSIDPLKQYRNITFDSSAVVTIPSGSSIRCSGTMTIAGQISSANGGAGGKIESGFDGGSLDSATRFPSSSLNYAPAARGEIVISSSSPSAGDGGVNQAASSDIESLKNTFKVGVISGGGGAGSLGGEGGVGGGSFALLCKQGITVSSSGVITLDGASGVSGAGGGAGGLVVLATNGTLANQGNIRARGGVGGATSNVSAGGGGGGGGIVNLVAALIQNTGTISVSGGIGAAAGSLPGGLSWRSGGGAGGSLGGVGGNGGNVINSSNTSTAGTNGANGQTFQTTVTGTDVAALLL